MGRTDQALWRQAALQTCWRSSAAEEPAPHQRCEWFEQRSVVVQLIGNFCAQTRRMLWIELICEVLESHRGCTELISKSVISAAAHRGGHRRAPRCRSGEFPAQPRYAAGEDSRFCTVQDAKLNIHNHRSPALHSRCCYPANGKINAVLGNVTVFCPQHRGTL
ncbi:uncharacterized protein LOC143164442 isoform X6 [Aptenodytes patagonicus]|uniref:uncharacterized protein LOC143164442 isoform X6 n=1 Tax=Aptenodytes patagonicus TaxID=9234 RepID=UPI003FA05F4B